MSKRVPGALFSAYLGSNMTLIESQGPLSDGTSVLGTPNQFGQIYLPECEGRISGEFAELMTASCRAAVPNVVRPRMAGAAHGLRCRSVGAIENRCSQA